LSKKIPKPGGTSRKKHHNFGSLRALAIRKWKAAALKHFNAAALAL